MLLPPGEFRSSVTGAWRVARMDPGAMGHFNLTIHGFWNSFRIVVAVLPLYLLAFYLLHLSVSEWTGKEPRSLLPFLATYTTIMVAHLALFALLMVPVTMLLKIQHRYISFIILWNWSSVLILAVLIPEAVLAWLGLLSGPLLGLAELLIRAALIMYSVLIARAGLEIPVFTALAIALLEQVVAGGLTFLVRGWI